ncbi:PH domain-containing protein [Streptosporangium sp. NPDC006013]|uniref:PH domain-containing protein n=1 Tax=Streptosporangium sp. NPDC006013 TaxID=3155596 RepID=UPI0033BCC26A
MNAGKSVDEPLPEVLTPPPAVPPPPPVPTSVPTSVRAPVEAQVPASAEVQVPTPTPTPTPTEARAPDGEEAPWQRLNSRLALVDATRFVLTILPSVLVTVVFGRGFDAWPVLIASALGVIVSVMALRRWLTTRFRITEDRVEIRRGMLVRKYRSVPRDRIRTVDTGAKLRHRLTGLRVVTIASGEARTSFKLDAVAKEQAEKIRDDLLGVQRNDADQPEVPKRAEETLLARLQWSWFFYNVLSVWAFLAAALFLWSTSLTLQMFDVDLMEIIRDAIGWEALGVGWSIAVGAGGGFLLGTVGLAISFVKERWNFELVRTRTDDGTALLTRQGLFQTREVYRDDRRLRGIHISEPLLSRWMGLAETEVISTGLRWIPGSDASSAILPRTHVSEAHRVAVLVLGDEHRPLQAPLRAHPRTALYRRLVGTVLTLGIVAGLLAWLGATGALVRGLWLIPVALIPVGGVLAFVAYRSLGHTMAGPYLVARSGLIRRATVVLQHRGVIGWTLSQSLLQRALGLKTVRVSSAAGARFYEIPDIAADEAVTFIHGGTPELVAEFLADRPAGDPPPDMGHENPSS